MAGHDRNPLDFRSKSVLVAGGSSGIGNAIACAFRDAGAAVLVTGTRERASYASDPYSDLAGLDYVQLDVTEDAQVRHLAAVVPELDVLVNAIGTIRYNDAEYDIEAFRRTIEESLIGPTHVYFALVDKLRARKGCIICLTAVSALYAVPGSPGYSASRAAVPTLMKTLGARWASDGVRVNAIAPGMVATTKLSEGFRADPEIYARTLAQIPLGRWTTREEVGGISLFLASSLAANITGQTLVVDGGVSTFPL